MEAALLKESTLIDNRYEVIKLLGVGGMGQVYQVKDLVSKSECALKLLSNKIASEDAYIQFKQEFWYMNKLKHPHIIHVHNFGVLENNSPYITMEIVPGEELTQISKISYEQIYQILFEVSKALGFIHSRLLLHCDIKSDNIRILPDGHIKLMDFGLMQQMNSRSTGKITGTVAYLPPEVPQGGVINASSDFYSLGVLAFELITGVQPFIGKTILDIIKAHIEKTPPPIKSFRKDIPKALEDIILKMMAKDQSDRFQNASDLLESLSKASGLKFSESIEEKKSYLNSHVLVGRDEELKILRRTLETPSDHNHSVFIGAPAGVGKSRLVEEFKLHTQLSEIAFCQGQCTSQGMRSYEPIIQALNEVIPLSNQENLVKHGPILTYLIPELSHIEGIQPLSGFDPKTQKIKLYESISEWLKEISLEKQFVIFIDDLHWSDLASLELLNYLIRELNDSSIMILGSFRDDEVQSNNPIWQTIEEELTTLLKLSPFSEAHMAELIQKMLVNVDLDSEFVKFLFGATSGNAFFITEIMRYLVEESLISRTGNQWIIPDNYQDWSIPTSINDTVVQRLSRLSKPAHQLISLASVVGRQIDLRLLQELAKVSEDHLFTYIEELIERQFVNRSEKNLTFPHDRVRETLYSNLEPSIKSKYHQQIADWMEEEGHYSAAQLAFHYKNGSNRHKAFQYLFKAGEESSVRMEQSFLIKEGLDILSRLNDVDEKELLLETQRKSLAWISYMIAPKITIEVCQNLIETHRDNQVSIEKYIEFESILISSYTMIGQNDFALEHAKKLISQLKPNTLPYALILFGRLNALLTRGEFRQLVEDMESAALVLKSHLQQLSRQMIWTYAFCCFIREDAIAWLGEEVGENEFAEVPLNIGSKHHFLDLTFWSYYPGVVRDSLTGNYHSIKDLEDELFSMIKKMGRPIQHENRFHLCLAFAAIESGKIEEGQILARKIVALGEQLNNPHQQASGKILQGMIAQYEGNFDDAIDYFSQAVDLGRKSKTDQLLPSLYRLANVHTIRKEWKQAEALIEESHALATSETLENPYHQIHTFRLKAKLALQDNDFDKAEMWISKSIDISETTKNPIQMGFSFWEQAKIFKVQNKMESCLHSYKIAQDHFKSIKNPCAKRIQQELEQLKKVPESKSKSVRPGGISSDQAEALGYRFIEMLQEMDLPQIKISQNAEVEKLSVQLQKVEKVNQFSQLIMSSLDLQLTLRRIIDYVIDITEADRGILMLIDTQGELASQVAQGKDGEALNEHDLMSYSKSFTQKVLDSGQSLWIQDAQSDQDLSQQESVMALDLRTIIAVPLKTENEFIGLMYLDRQAITKTFSQADLKLVESMATFATISLVNARLHHQVEERNERLNMLNDISKAISTTIEFDDLLTLVLTFCLNISQAENGYLFLTKHEKPPEALTYQDIECRIGLDKSENKLEEVLVSKSIIKKVLTNNKPLCLLNTDDDEEIASQQSVMALDLRSLMCVPITGKDNECFGLVYLSSQAVNYCFTNKDLTLMESVIRQVGLAINNRHLLEIRKKQELIEKELSVARKIQTSMLPDYVPEIRSLDVAGYSESATEVGGDYYDYLKISDSQFGIALGDVNGHGVSASLLMAMAKSCLFVQGKIDPGVIPMMEALNSMIFGGTKERLFMTFIYSIFDLVEQKLTLSSAGHHLPYLYRHETGQLESIQARPVYPLGVRETCKFKEAIIELKPHDVLVYYTDGIVEAHNKKGMEFGFERFEELIVENSHLTSEEIKEVLIEHYLDWIDGQEPEDDMTLVVVKSLPLNQINDETPSTKLKTGRLTLINR